MIINLHTPTGIIPHKLTAHELEQLAADGDRDARIEIARVEMPPHTDPHKKIDLLAWLLGLVDTRPKPTSRL